MGFAGNILFFFCNAIAPEKGGVERWCASVRGDFEARGNGVSYLAAKPVWKEFADAERQFFLPNAGTFDCAENAAFFEKLLREKDIRVVLYLWADGKRFPFAREAAACGVPVVAAIRTDPCFYERRLRGGGLLMRVKRFLRFRRQAKIYRANAAVCAATVLLSESFVPGFLKHFPRGAAPRVLAIPNPSAYEGVPADFAAKKRELLFVGRMETRVKQPQLLLDAWRKIQSRFPEWRLRMVGGGFDFDAVKAHAVRLGVERVSFEGFSAPAPFYRDAAIFCMTSAYEGFPNVLVEAANFGCVLVAFDSFAAVRDIISDGENGALVPAFDTEKYAETLALLMGDDAARERLARAARRDVARFARSRILDCWDALFAGLKGGVR
ncbi:MAG: glycosyltransferase [Candidatus Spyradosoma sp.]